MIQHVYYINLKHRTDRLKHVNNELSKIGLTGNRFNAIYNEKGAIGCTISHLHVIRNAIKLKLDHLLVVEDDITFTNPELFVSQLNKFLSTHTDDWDVLLLGGNVVGPVTAVDDTCVRVSACQTTTGYLVRGDYLTTLEQNIASGLKMLLQNQSDTLRYAIDRYWFTLQQADRWMLLTPLLVTQIDNDYSDIEHRRTSYSSLMIKPLIHAST